MKKKTLAGRKGTEKSTINSASLDDSDNLVVGGKTYPVRDIQSIELRHDMKGDKNSLDVFIGCRDPGRRSLFTRIAVNRTFAGVVDVNGEAAEFLRNEFRGRGVPVIEI